MRQFSILLRKEITELITWQIILPLLVTAGIFFGLGGVIGSEQEKAKAPQAIVVVDRDTSPSSTLVIDTLKANNFTPTILPASTTEAEILSRASGDNAQVALVIPEGFGDGINKAQPQQLTTYSFLRSFSLVANQNSFVLQNALSAINTAFSKQLISLSSNLPAANILLPVSSTDKVVVGQAIANTSLQAVLGYVNAQTTFIPLILFFVIVFAAQMIATAVASEKENKTIETLLTMPVKRSHVVTAKMLAAGIVAMVASIVYLVGFQSYMQGITGGASLGNLQPEIAQALGLTFSTLDYLTLGVSLFMGILVSLAIAMILGSFAEDIKSVQGLITPLMVLVIIPYILVFLVDIASLSPLLQNVVKAIPFTHSFTAAPNLLLKQDSQVYWGILYQFVCFIVFVTIAAKIFTTDRIITLKITFSKAKKPNA
ncbi:ABC transporter permease [soil metagenome]